MTIEDQQLKVPAVEFSAAKQEIARLEAENAALRVQLARISGALVDAGNVVVEPYDEAVRALVAQRNKVRGALDAAVTHLDHMVGCHEDIDCVSCHLADTCVVEYLEAQALTTIEARDREGTK